MDAALAKALKALGLPSLTFYQAGRHTFGAQWAIAGLNICVLRDLIGHASIETTMQYAHLLKGAPIDLLKSADVAL